ncbi:type II secretion system GspH family protein [Skermanella rosea]|uniref:type II secretion system protein n=1 Tax=Skermanella rosea TaxID=1817965 RepID=UPI0019311EDF|nr:type II secretion system protein [Skermanella rosea]UEM06292.1 type II secretion system GspH family protein [Skermanella rosea]
MTDVLPVRRQPRALGRRAGFSLIEVLVALAILGIALGAMLPRLSFGSLASERAERTEEAVMLAERLLAEVGRTMAMPSGTPLDGTSPDGFSWRIETCCVRALRDATGRNTTGIADVRVEVSWLSMRGSRNISMVTRRMMPGEAR